MPSPLLRARLSLGNSLSSFNVFGNRQLCSLFTSPFHFGSLLRTRLFASPALILDNNIKPLLFLAVTRLICSVRPPPSPFALSPVVTDSHLPKHGCSRDVSFSAKL
ncbi:uncharacterized protein TrAFT101_008630 [Trichoderma asperellum]|uniref:uncharacterized protein n=1 Tax=Trichoderma asperellum TaxID=101201 RepID=UPI00331B2224|nr:hypothetical protein TrAFT101_008630 [Trichoderma asperellum]